jgi:hypothetical protein
MDKGIFVGMVIGALAISLAASAVLTTDADATSKIIRERANKVLDKHIEVGGEHAKGAQEIKNKLNACCPLCGC